MLKSLTIFLCSVITLSWTFPTNAEISINELIFSNEKPFHLKLLDVLPNEAKIEYGPEYAENTIIEFMDYYCGFCKKIHPELINIADERDDVRLVFLHYPVISENSKTIAKFIIAAGFQNKSFDLHHSIFSISGSITQKKLDQAIEKSGINKTKLKIDIGRPDNDKIIHISSFLAGGIGARGTPAIFINEEFSAGYISKQQIISLLK